MDDLAIEMVEPAPEGIDLSVSPEGETSLEWLLYVLGFDPTS